MTSLRLRLFLLIAAATALVWSLAATWTALSARADVERVLDARLREAAVMVASLGYTDGASPMNAAVPTPIPLPSYERQLSCQIWSVSGNLLGMSEGAPTQALSAGEPGFSEPVVDGVSWRVYTHVASDTGLTIMVGDTLAVRQQLITGLVRGLLVPAMVGLVALALLLWIGVGRGLNPVRRIAEAIAYREPDDQSPLDVDRVPRELAPLTLEIDQLFARIDRLRASERRFLASAAHEMQTPLAGLRTHADIALYAQEEETRQRALNRIRQSVDRTARLVRQLLEWSRQDAKDQTLAEVTVVGPAAQLVQEELTHLLERRGVTLVTTDAARAQKVPLTQEALVIALRNLVENAALHGPKDATICIDAIESGFVVIDHGEGFPLEDGAKMLEPFARGRATNLPGSGLGLAIAASAIAPMMAISFEQNDAGFRIVAKPTDNSYQR